MEKDYQEAEERKALMERVAKNKAEADARTQKNAEKRSKKKEKQKLMKKMWKTTNGDKNVSDHPDGSAVEIDSDDDVSEENVDNKRQKTT